MSTRTIPPWIYCPRCGSKMDMAEDKTPEVVERIRKQGYTSSARGVCECGVIAVLCYQPLPETPTFSLFFDIYTPDAVRPLLLAKKNK